VDIFSKGRDLISKQRSAVQSEKMASVINCDYSENTGLVEKILVLVLILEIFPNFLFELKKSFLPIK
jgi:hypothetical protein